MTLPCRFCKADAHEAICLDCKHRFEMLRLENEHLRKQIAIYRNRDVGRYKKTKARMERKIRSK